MDGGAVADFAIAIEGSRIVETGSSSDLRGRYPTAERVGGSQLVMLPALCDSHDHGRGIGSTPLGVPDDVLEVWLVGLAAQPRLDPYLLAVYDGLRLVRSGVSTVLHSHNTRDINRLDSEVAETLRGYSDVGIRVAFDLPIVDQNLVAYESLPPGIAVPARPLLEPGKYFELCTDLASKSRGDDMVSVCVGPAGPQWASDDLMSACTEFARGHDLRMHVHALETWYQRQYGFRRWGTSVVRHLDEIGLLGPWLTLAHAIWLEPDDIPLLAERGVGIAHNPSSNLRLRSGIAPVARLLAAGIPVGVGLDGHALDDDQDYLRELRLAWTLANRPGADSSTVSTSQVLRMGAEDGAAITLGPGARLSRLEAGYVADLTLVERGAGLDDWSMGLAGAHDLTHALQLLPQLLLRGASRRHVRDVMINGTWVVRDARSTRLDEQAIADRLREKLSHLRAPTSVELSALEAHVRAFYRGWGDPPASPT
jgi:cytosine/adenosine deaminase-related metal-dependent hydrolase